ncbi:MAG TPA: peptidoglycan DD-metalloendopeptidase family protein [bacterium]|nr:peptidoglycan DD-metalloendopeptidase family protein [bacterium]
MTGIIKTFAFIYALLISVLPAPVLGKQIAQAAVPNPVLAHLQASLKTYTNDDGRTGLFQCPAGVGASFAKMWTEFATADLNLLVGQTESLIISAKVQSKNEEMDAIIARLSRTKSHIVTLQKTAADLTCECPVWATFRPDMTVVQERGSTHEARCEFACFVRAILTQFSNALVEARSSQERLQAKQQQTLAEIAQLRSELAAQEEQLDASRSSREDFLASLYQEINDKMKCSQTAAFCRARLLSALKNASKTCDRTYGGLSRRLPAPVASPPAEAPKNKEPPIRITLGSELDVEPLAPVFSVGDGEVLLAECAPGFGLTVVLSHGASEMTVFSHLAAALVRPGARVKVGQQIAFSGQSGLTQHPSLLFALLKDGRFNDPRPRIDWPSCRKEPAATQRSRP